MINRDVSLEIMSTIFLFYFGLIFVNHRWVTNGIALNPAGGSPVGDPAPGRSPGPPDVWEDVKEIKDAGDNVSSNCELRGTVKDPSDDFELNFTISHPLFSTEEVMPGVIYQGMLLNEQINI